MTTHQDKRKTYKNNNQSLPNNNFIFPADKPLLINDIIKSDVY